MPVKGVRRFRRLTSELWSRSHANYPVPQRWSSDCAPRALIAPAVLASALVATAAVGVIAGGRPVAALSTANQSATDAKAVIAKTVAKTAGWRVITAVGPV